MAEERNNIKVFVSSTVYDFENELRQIYALLDGYGYEVHLSKEGTIPLDSRSSNADNCVRDVNQCNVFVGIIRPLLGSGILEKNGPSITEMEFDAAFSSDMPRFVLADYRVEFAHKFLDLMQINPENIPFTYEKKVEEDGIFVEKRRSNKVVHSACVNLYRKSIKDGEDIKRRKGNWAQPFKDLEDILRHLEAQFKDVERIKKLLA